MQDLRLGQSAALETLVYRYHRQLHAYLYRMLGSATLAEDLTQECFIRVMESVRKGRLPDVFRPWLYKIAGNLCRDLWKKASYRNEQLDNEYAKELPAGDNVAHIFEKQTEREMVVAALQQIDAEDRDIVVMRFYQELKLEEIAEIVDIPLSTVKGKLYRSLKKLHEIMKQAEESAAAMAVSSSGEGGRS